MEVLVAVGVMVPVAVGVFVGVRAFKVAVGEGVVEAVDVTVGVGVVVGEAVDVVVGGVPVIVEVMVGVGVRVTVPVGGGVVVCVVVAVLVARRTGISSVASGTSAASASIASGLFATHCAYSAVSILAEICGTGLDSSRKYGFFLTVPVAPGGICAFTPADSSAQYPSRQVLVVTKRGNATCEMLNMPPCTDAFPDLVSTSTVPAGCITQMRPPVNCRRVKGAARSWPSAASVSVVFSSMLIMVPSVSCTRARLSGPVRTWLPTPRSCASPAAPKPLMLLRISTVPTKSFNDA